MILHIPHSSTNIPFIDGFVHDDMIIQDEVNLLTDWYTDEIFDFEDAITVKAEFSRIFCDVERFPEDKDEIMAEFGMGVCYTKTDHDKKLRDVSDELKKKILDEYYWQHHLRLEQEVDNELKKCGKSLILDCHSFPNKPFKRDLEQSSDRPDINIGTDSFHTPRKLLEESVIFFQDRCYSVLVDNPYVGTIVPLKHYGKNKEVNSIMLEINRKLYLDDERNKYENFNILKDVIADYIKLLITRFG